MSYEIIKYVTFDEKRKTVKIACCSNNVVPKTYEPWCPTDAGYGYSEWKRMFAGSLFDGSAKFQPSCKSKAKRAYDQVNAVLGIVGCEPWSYARRKFPFEIDYGNYPSCKTQADEEIRLQYEKFRERWEALFLDALNMAIGSAEPLTADWSGLA